MVEYRDEGFSAAAGWDERSDDATLEESRPESERSLWPVAAGAAVLLWLAVSLWLAWPRLGTIDGVGLVQFLAALCVIPLLVIGLWLLAQRNSRVEARRFGDVARAMQLEAAQLERTVGTLSRAMDVNRAKLAEQVTALLVMGDAANTRLSGLERDIGAEIARVDNHARNIAEATATAQASVAALLASLPRTQAGVEETTQLLDRAGATAAEHAALLDDKLAGLAERGRDAEALARGAAQSLQDQLTDIEARSTSAVSQLDAVTSQMSGTLDALVERTTTTIDGARESLAAQGETMVATLSAHQAQLDRAARESVDGLSERVMSVEQVIERVSGRLDAQAASGDLIVDRLRAGIGDVENQLDRLHSQGSERAQMLAASISALGGSADAMTEALKAGDAMATRTIITTESLLIALDAATREIDETLPEALTRLDARIIGTKRMVAETKPELLALVTAAESTHDAIEAIAGVIAEQRRTLDQLSGQLGDTLSQGRAKADALGHTVEEAIERSKRFADEAAPQLVQSLLRVRDSAATAAESARDTLAAVVRDAATRMETASAEALRRAAQGTVEQQVQLLTAATQAAVDAAAQAAERVARETQAIADQTAIVEARIEQARDEREKGNRDNLSRRVAGLIEALNSASIDIAKMISPDVSDSAWAAYLKGDRGVFTRRAVRLLDGGDAREVARLYDSDTSFRESVNRYIHDFEAMIRGVLQQSDGSSLSITLLSSDMGKLYVALAQAIERLR